MKNTPPRLAVVPWSLCNNDGFELTAIVAKQRGCNCGHLTSHILPYNQLTVDIEEYDDNLTCHQRDLDEPHPFKELAFFQALTREQKTRFSIGLFNDTFDNSLLTQQHVTDSETTGCEFCKIITRSLWMLMINERQPYYAPCHVPLDCGLVFQATNYTFKKGFNCKTLFTPKLEETMKRRLRACEHAHQVDRVKNCTRAGHGGINKPSRLERTELINPLEDCSKKSKEHRTISKYTFHRDTSHVTMVLTEEGAHHCPGVKLFVHCFKHCIVEYLNNSKEILQIVGMTPDTAPESPQIKIRVALRIFRQLMTILCSAKVLLDKSRMIRLRGFWEHVLTDRYPMETRKMEDLNLLNSL